METVPDQGLSVYVETFTPLAVIVARLRRWGGSR
jgi:hypothetical protein